MFKILTYRRLLLILLIAILFYSCRPKKVNFSVAIPKGWLVIDSVDEVKERLLRMYPSKDTSEPTFSENIVIGIVHSENRQKYLESLTDRLKHEVNFYKETGRGVAHANSFQTDWVQYLIQINPQSDTAEQKIYFIESEERIFQIICSAKPNEIVNISDEIATVLNSFIVLYQ